MIFSSLVNKGINDIVAKDLKLPCTIAKVENITNEGFFIDCSLIIRKDNLETYKNIPVMKNKYFNYPILQGDLVVLIEFSHQQSSFFENGQMAEIVNSPSYLALPWAVAMDFKHLNEISVITPESKVKMQMNDTNGVNLEAPEVDIVSKAKNKTEEYSENVTMKSKAYANEADEISMKASKPITIETSEKLGATLEGLINNLISAIQNAGNPMVVGQATSTPNPSLPGDIAKIQQDIAKLKQIVS